MPCMIALLAFFFPRVVIAILALLTNYMHVYQSFLWPLLGFFFMPYTTLAYAWAMNAQGSVSGFYLVIVIIAVLVDLGVTGGGARVQRTRVVRVERVER